MIRRNDVKRVVERGEGKGSLESSDPLQVSTVRQSQALRPSHLETLRRGRRPCVARSLPPHASVVDYGYRDCILGRQKHAHNITGVKGRELEEGELLQVRGDSTFPLGS